MKGTTLATSYLGFDFAQILSVMEIRYGKLMLEIKHVPLLSRYDMQLQPNKLANVPSVNT